MSSSESAAWCSAELLPLAPTDGDELVDSQAIALAIANKLLASLHRLSPAVAEKNSL
jgi:hypothetical protein